MDKYNLEATEYRCETCAHFPPSSTDGKPCRMCDPDNPVLNAYQKRAADPELTYYEPDDYIRRGDALREVCRMQCNDTPEHCELIGGECARCGDYRAFMEIPAAEVAPVVYAELKWELAENGLANHICTNCGYTKNTDIHVTLDYNFCPKCGARFRGKASKQ